MGGGIGKQVRGALYVHRSALSALDPAQLEAVDRADRLAGRPDWNVVRLSPGIIGLMHYSDFESDAFPRLSVATRIDLESAKVGRTRYRESRNPLILHRKELLLLEDDPRRKVWGALTRQLDHLGLFADQNRIGRLMAWRAILAAAGLDEQGRPS